MIAFVNAQIVDSRRIVRGWLIVDGDTIVARGEDVLPATYAIDETVDCRGAYLMPGAIDCHVHFREPGMTHKGCIASESRAAVAGGVTSYLDMPNTKPPTTTLEAWQQKMDIAARDSAANYGFFLGATDTNSQELGNAPYTRCPGIKIFMGSSTGGMLLDDDGLMRGILERMPSVPIAVHAEDEATIRRRRELSHDRYGTEVPISAHPWLRPAEACMEATKRAVEMACDTGAHLHICHVSTRQELELLSAEPVDQKKITAETCPQYLLFDDTMYQRLGSRMKCNPAVKSRDDRMALVEAVRGGLIDTIATDHAPHLLSEKQGDALTAASGMPGVQFAYPLMVDLFGPQTAVRTMAENPSAIYRIARRGSLDVGNKADIVVMRKLDAPHTITDADVISPCGWTPYAGMDVAHEVVAVWVNGRCAMTRTPDGPLQFTSKDGMPSKAAQPLEFVRLNDR